jgi:YebC/PmpR family DNA-binding regulatory protein
MPNDRIKKAIETAVGKNDGDNFEDIRYEGYGAGGVAIIVEALTDNRNRTAGDVRAAFSKCGGNLGETNSVSFMFDHVGEILYPVNVADADEIFEQAVEAGAENVESNDEYHEITTKPDQLMPITDFLTAKYGAPEKSAVIWRPNVMTEVNEDILRSILKLIDLLEDSDDVQNVTANFSASDELLDKLMAE